MTYAKLKALKAEDFLSPNPVLCYGGGAALQCVAPYMADCGINIVGVIDANKTGSVEIKGRDIPLLTVQKAIETYGTNTIVIITISRPSVFEQVKQNLIRHGYIEDRIFDLNVWTWLTVSSEKSCCKDLTGYLNLFCEGIAKCCKGGIKDPFSVNGLWRDDLFRRVSTAFFKNTCITSKNQNREGYRYIVEIAIF